MKNLLKFFFSFLVILFLSSCGDDVNCDDPNITSSLTPFVDAASTTGIAYYNDTSSENCNAYKDALNTYFDKLNDLKQCAVGPGEEAQFKEAIEFAQGELSDLGC